MRQRGQRRQQVLSSGAPREGRQHDQPWLRARAGRGGAAPRRGRRRASATGSAGGRTSPSASGARCARTTRPTATAGTTSRTTTRAAAPTAGARTACSASRDRECRLCFALALWNGRDPILKERLFGLTGPEGNHGEDVKECYYYLDSTPTHSYMKALYKYPQARVPVRAAGRGEPPARHATSPSSSSPTPASSTTSRYFDVFAEYAKAAPDDVLIRITVANRGPEAATLHVLPTLWFRNTWSWGRDGRGLLAEAAHRAATAHGDRRPSTRRSAASASTPSRRPTAARPSCSSPRTRRTPQRLFGAPNADAATSRTRSTSYVVARPARTR